MCATRIRAVVKTHALQQAQGMAVHLPACSRIGLGLLIEYFNETVYRALHFDARPFRALSADMILPAHMVMAMDADFKSIVAHLTHDGRTGAADVGAGQQRSIQQGLDTVMFQHRSTRHLAQETGAEYAPDGAPGMIRAQREKESGLGLMALECLHQTWHTFMSAAIGINVDFQSEQGHIESAQ